MQRHTLSRARIDTTAPASRRAALAALSALACAGVLAACGGDDDEPAPPPPPPATPTARACDIGSFADVRLDNATVQSATAVPAGSYTPPGARAALTGLPAFCRLQGTATPSADSLIRFEVWVPAGDAWNGKLVTTGNGGYSPALSYGDMAYAMRQGYAVIGGDTGHQSTDPNEMFWGVGHPEKIRDWGTRSINAITVPGKQLIAALQAKAPARAYYYGCSTGGHQGYAEMQRYPADFDGVIAGAPGNNRVRLNIEFLYRFQSNRTPGDNATLILPPAKAALVTSTAVAACDALDGVTDGVMEDPRACTPDRFDVDAMLCPSGDAPTCLTAAQIDVVRKIHAGPKNPRTGAQLYPGYPVGSESGWPSYWGATEPVRADFWRLWVFDNPQWDWWTFDYDRDVTYADAKVGGLVDQTSTDLSAFKARGGKAIVYQGWQDPVVNPLDTIAYYERMRGAQGGQAQADDFFRLFLVPGMGHCSGGSGATNFGNGGAPSPTPDAGHDLLMALDEWVERGVAPDRIVAAKVTNGATTRTRPLCPYPKKAIYSGTGNTDDAASFTCG
ncbi:tannase/feruloyl esterase family alpha/beta hydrolase [Cupriavidus respiraculi]|uniref:tannase/feruloyl esterase family alpha/beta hydrolase n=1 Tax=Cupriavidus respiraculi TaxID=195930 RepID=UPI001C97BC73|nr:tannase/feruloyl esterase family alpha/beta hydrolase [Cupriavidus respiraculi]MBY4946083.1 tannase/feruloyl esterase family alpha/beta hydrolase [Cupriavidus respiraculi]